MSRLDIQKTYKLYIGGKFPRTESGRYFSQKDLKGNTLANLCLASRKDFRNAVVVARKAQSSWAKMTALNKGQILYRIAEMLESRKDQFVNEMTTIGVEDKTAIKDVEAAIDRLVYYAGWSDKYQQFFSTVNPVSSPHFNFSMPEPMGVISAIVPENQGLLGLVSILAPVVVGGNTTVILASQNLAMSAISFAEVLHSSDVPAGVINILTGDKNELIPHMASHMDVNAIIYCGQNAEEIEMINKLSSENIKRSIVYKKNDWFNENNESPYFIDKTQELKTTWHPTEI